MRRFKVSLDSSWGDLVDTSPSTIRLPLGA